MIFRSQYKQQQSVTGGWTSPPVTEKSGLPVRTKQNDPEHLQMKKRFVVLYEVNAGKLTATEGAERLGVSRKTFYEYMEAFLSAAATALTPGEPGRPKLTDETLRIRELEKEKKQLEAALYEARAISELQHKIIEIRNAQLAEREKKRN